MRQQSEQTDKGVSVQPEFVIRLGEQDLSYEIIDSHAHIFPAKIAVKAAQSIGEFYNIGMRYDGTIESLLASGDRIGVSRYIVHSTATKIEQVIPINDFIFSTIKEYNCFIGYGTLCPGMGKKETFDEVERIISLGLKGIKLHPDFQKFNIDDESAFLIYEACEGRLPILFHVGDDRYDTSSPTRLLNVLNKFPNLTAIAAHLGGYQRWDEAMGTISDTQCLSRHMQLAENTCERKSCQNYSHTWI